VLKNIRWSGARRAAKIFTGVLFLKPQLYPGLSFFNNSLALAALSAKLNPDSAPRLRLLRSKVKRQTGKHIFKSGGARRFERCFGIIFALRFIKALSGF
jgi:hypothetical protein